MEATNDIFQELMDNLQDITRHLSHINATPLARGEVYVLNYLIQHDGSSLPGELCINMEVSKARISSALHVLEEKHFVVKEPDAADKRRIHIRITDQGRAYIEKKRRETLKNICLIFSRLEEEERREYLRLTKKIIDISEKVKESNLS